MRYLPFMDGKYSVTPGLVSLTKVTGADRFYFQMDHHYHAYLKNKSAARRENIHKYYVRAGMDPATEKQANRFLVKILVEEYPALFEYGADYPIHYLVNHQTGEKIEWKDDWIKTITTGYEDLFDALCDQVQEDIAICEMQPGRDWVSAIHLMAPNHWSPAEKIGKPFGEIHGVVPGMEKLNQHYGRVLESILMKGPFIRFAWGISTDRQLNHHPEPPPRIDISEWQGRQADVDADIYIRVERQLLSAIPERSAFLFFIRTYFYAIDELTATEKKALADALRSMSPASLAYKGLTGKVEGLVGRLLAQD